MNTRTILLWIFIILGIGIALAVLQQQSQPPPTPDFSTTPSVSPSPSLPSGWLTTTTEAGVEFSYPENLVTQYIQPVDWPPTVRVSSKLPPCTEAGSPEERSGKTTKESINGHTYCVTTITEGAAGSIYTMYAYATTIQQKEVIFTFSLRAPQCANYEDPKKAACEQEEQTFDIAPVIDQIIQSAKLTR